MFIVMSYLSLLSIIIHICSKLKVSIFNLESTNHSSFYAPKIVNYLHKNVWLKSLLFYKSPSKSNYMYVTPIYCSLICLQTYHYPEDAGFVLGDPDGSSPEYFLVEVHYDNPDLLDCKLL